MYIVAPSPIGFLIGRSYITPPVSFGYAHYKCDIRGII